MHHPPYILFRRTQHFHAATYPVSANNDDLLIICHYFRLPPSLSCHCLLLNWDASLPSSPDDVLFEWPLSSVIKMIYRIMFLFLSTILPARRVLREGVIRNSLYTLQLPCIIIIMQSQFFPTFMNLITCYLEKTRFAQFLQN